MRTRSRAVANGDELVDLRCAHRWRLLDEHVLAGLERLLGKRVVRWHRCRNHNALHVRVGEHRLVGVGDLGAGVARCERRAQLLVEVAEPRQRAELREVARQFGPQ